MIDSRINTFFRTIFGVLIAVSLPLSALCYTFMSRETADITFFYFVLAMISSFILAVIPFAQFEAWIWKKFDV